jgi:hypothetical protein
MAKIITKIEIFPIIFGYRKAEYLAKILGTPYQNPFIASSTLAILGYWHYYSGTAWVPVASTDTVLMANSNFIRATGSIPNPPPGAQTFTSAQIQPVTTLAAGTYLSKQLSASSYTEIPDPATEPVHVCYRIKITYTENSQSYEIWYPQFADPAISIVLNASKPITLQSAYADKQSLVSATNTFRIIKPATDTAEAVITTYQSGVYAPIAKIFTYSNIPAETDTASTTAPTDPITVEIAANGLNQILVDHAAIPLSDTNLQAANLSRTWVRETLHSDLLTNINGVTANAVKNTMRRLTLGYGWSRWFVGDYFDESLLRPISTGTGQTNATLNIKEGTDSNTLLVPTSAATDIPQSTLALNLAGKMAIFLEKDGKVYATATQKTGAAIPATGGIKGTFKVVGLGRKVIADYSWTTLAISETVNTIESSIYTGTAVANNGSVTLTFALNRTVLNAMCNNAILAEDLIWVILAPVSLEVKIDAGSTFSSILSIDPSSTNTVHCLLNAKGAARVANGTMPAKTWGDSYGVLAANYLIRFARCIPVATEYTIWGYSCPTDANIVGQWVKTSPKFDGGSGAPLENLTFASGNATASDPCTTINALNGATPVYTVSDLLAQCSITLATPAPVYTVESSAANYVCSFNSSTTYSQTSTTTAMVASNRFIITRTATDWVPISNESKSIDVNATIELTTANQA